MLSRAERTLALAIFLLVSVITLYPLAVLVSTSLEPVNQVSNSPISFSHPLSVSAFGYAWQVGDFSTYMLNTAIVTLSVMAISAVVAVLAAYSIALLRPPGSMVVFYVGAIGFMLPVETLVIAWYYEFNKLGLLNGYWAMILPQVAQSVAFGIVWLVTAFRSLPRQLGEAAVLGRFEPLGVTVARVGPEHRARYPDDDGPGVPLDVELVFAALSGGVQSFAIYVVTVGLSTFQGAHGNNYSALAAGSMLAGAPRCGRLPLLSAKLHAWHVHRVNR